MNCIDLTQGSVPHVLLRFSIPFLLANILQALYGGADLFIIGQYGQAADVAAISIGSQVMQTITCIILGITTGVTVLLAIATGARDNQRAAATIGSGIWLFSGIGAILTLGMTLCHGYITRCMSTPPEAVEGTDSYILICSLGIPFIMGYNVLCGILRGLGNSRTPLIFVAIACVINIILDYILIGAAGMGVAGAAIATITAQGISFLIALAFVRRTGFPFSLFPAASTGRQRHQPAHP